MHLVPPRSCTAHVAVLLTSVHADRQTADTQAGGQARLTDKEVLQVKANMSMYYQKLTKTCTPVRIL